MTQTNVAGYWVYILLCENNTYYTGYTNNLEKRYQSHVSGTGRCKYTRSFKPIKIAQSWPISGGKAMAMKIERKIKKLSRAEKEKIIAQPTLLKINDTLDQDLRKMPRSKQKMILMREFSSTK